MKEGIVAVLKPGCPACDQSKPGLRAASKRKHVPVRMLDADKHPSLAENISAYPAIYYNKPSGTLVEMPWSGPPNATSLEQFAKAAKNNGKKKTTATDNKKAPGNGGCNRCGDGGTKNGSDVDPRIWGPSMWFVIHTVALTSAPKPTPAQRAASEMFVRSLAGVLPCHLCRTHFAAALDALPPRVFASRDAFFEWTVNFHNQVNRRIDKPGPMRSVAFWKTFYTKKLGAKKA